MVVQPRLVGNLIPGRSNWKAIGQTDIFVLQHHPRQAARAYRIITRGFPHYRGKPCCTFFIFCVRWFAVVDMWCRRLLMRDRVGRNSKKAGHGERRGMNCLTVCWSTD